ncbi:MAG: M14 family zinc carboxypeptidase [bacterium]
MKTRALHTKRTFLFSLFTLISSSFLFLGIYSRAHLTSKSIPGSGQNRNGKKNATFLTLKQKHISKTRVASFFSPTRNKNISPAYKSLEQIESDLRYLHLKYPKLLHLEKIGESTALKLPIWAVKVSNNAAYREDEPRILFTALHHAREPIGANICLNIIESLCRGYGVERNISRWLNQIEIWFVPVVNPDGYKYVIDNDLGFPWWRKNLRDNDGDGIFNPLFDGVDLNRNYDYNWREGGDGKLSSWFYRGVAPFSEDETLSIQTLAIRENFVMGISYHSYGESILFPWGNFERPPDLELIMDIASKMASRMTKESGRGRYSILPLNGRVGQSSIWMYGQLRVLDYIVEVGTDYFPPENKIDSILHEHLKSAYYLFDRMLQTGVKGYVFDRQTRHPLFAEVEVRERSARNVRPRLTDSEFGSFYRLLNPGHYTLEIKSEGYYTKILKRVEIRKNRFVTLNVGLRKRKMSNGTSH